MYQISSESPEFYRRYYKKHFGLSFLDTLYNVHNGLVNSYADVTTINIFVIRKKLWLLNCLLWQKCSLLHLHHIKTVWVETNW